MAAEQHIDHGHAGDGAVHVHIASSQFYWGIFAALICLTIVTVRVSYYDFGSANIIIALLIATMKASLVAAFFMHLRHDALFNTVGFIAAFLFLAIFILLTYDDMGRRGEIDPDYGGKVQLRSGEAAPGGMPATTATADEAEKEAPAQGAKPGEGAKPKEGEKKE